MPELRLTAILICPLVPMCTMIWSLITWTRISILRPCLIQHTWWMRSNVCRAILYHRNGKSSKMTGGMGGKQVGPMNKVVQHEKSEFIGTVQLSKKKKKGIWTWNKVKHFRPSNSGVAFYCAFGKNCRGKTDRHWYPSSRSNSSLIS